jgi:hypothetical protein
LAAEIIRCDWPLPRDFNDIEAADKMLNAARAQGRPTIVMASRTPAMTQAAAN